MKILCIIALNLAFFLRTLKYNYCIDDLSVFRGEGYHPLKTLWLQLRGAKYSNPISEHSLTIIIHTIVCCMIYLGFSSWFPKYEFICFMGALLFSINPANEQVSIWLSGRQYGLSTIMSLLMLVFPILTPVLYYYAPFFAYNGAFTPLVFIGSNWWFWFLVPFAGFLVKRKYLLKNVLFVKGKSATKEMVLLVPRKFILVFKTLGFYVFNALVPNKLGVFHNFIMTYGINEHENRKAYKKDRWFYFGIFSLIVMIPTIVFNFKNPLGFGLFWFLITIAQWLNFVTMQQAIASRYLYLPNCGLMVSLSTAIFKLPYPFNYLLFTAYMVFYGVRLWYYTPAYKTIIHQMLYNLQSYEDNFAVWNYIGTIANKMNKSGLALDVWQEGLRHRPDDLRLNFNLAHIYNRMGMFDRALEHLSIAEKALIPETQKEYISLMVGLRQSILNAKKAREDEALKVSRKSKKWEI